MRQCYQWGTDAACYACVCVCLCVCTYVFETCTFFTMCLNNKLKSLTVITNCELYISLSSQNSVFTFDHISSHLSPLPPLSALAPLVESVAMVTAGRSQIGCIRLFPLTLVLLLKLPISLTDLLERRRRLCEYILINKNGRALRRERKGENIGRKYDVSKWRG